MCYRSIRQVATLDLPATISGSGPAAVALFENSSGNWGAGETTGEISLGAPGLATLFSLASDAVSVGLLGPDLVCGALSVSELLLPETRRLYRACLVALARNLEQAHQLDQRGFEGLSAAVISDLLQLNEITVRSGNVFNLRSQ